MAQKTYRGQIEFKQDADQTGEFRAEFATLNVIDHDQDVTVSGAFHDGQETLIEAWNHNYGVLPVGKGVIHEDGDKAVVEGRFFLDTQGGLEHYKTVKALGAMQEWSYTFDIEESGEGEFNDQDVRFLRKLDVWGVAPVQRGAGIDTRTTDIKGLKPYANEHACRLRDPDDFQDDHWARMEREHDGKKYSVIMGRLEGEDTMTEQAYRYSVDVWTETEAQKHCADHRGHFEAATGDTAKWGAGGGAEGYRGGRPKWRRDLARRLACETIQQNVSTHRRYHMVWANLGEEGPLHPKSDDLDGIKALPEDNWEDGERTPMKPVDVREAHWLVVAVLERQFEVKYGDEDEPREFDHPKAPSWATELVPRKVATDTMLPVPEDLKGRAGGGEGEAGDGKPSGRDPRDVQVQLDILKLSMEV